MTSAGTGLGKCSKIRHIVRLRQMVRRWRQKAAESSQRSCVPPDVPAGHVAVTVGRSGRRFIVRATQLNHPIIRRLLAEAEEEYGFANQWGPLSLPSVDEVFFQDILCFIARPDSSSFSSPRLVNLEDLHRHCLVGESLPLLPRNSVR